MKLVFTSRTSPLKIPFTVPVKTFIPLQKSIPLKKTIPRGHLTRSVIGTIHSISTSKSSSCGSCGRK
jgi:hypothetical protein